jgi:ribonuclease P protein component
MIFTATIKSNSEFVRVYKNGRHYAGKYLVLHVLKCEHSVNSLGINASRKVGKSVRRNRIKRLIKENYRLYEAFIRIGYLVVFVVRTPQDGNLPNFHDLHREMKSLFNRAGVFDRTKWENTQNGPQSP